MTGLTVTIPFIIAAILIAIFIGCFISLQDDQEES